MKRLFVVSTSRKIKIKTEREEEGEKLASKFIEKLSKLEVSHKLTTVMCLI